MGVIYKPGGKACEYSLLALNHYVGCPHACTYCYVPSVLRIKAEEFHAGAEPKKDILARLGKELPKYAGTDKRVLLSFACDPYPPQDAARQLTRKILVKLSRHDIPFHVLTKAGQLATRDLDVFGPNDAFAVTLTTLDARQAEKIEPGAGPPIERTQALMEAKSRGIETWVSLEPIIDPAWSLEIISRTHDYVDLYKIGPLNHAGPQVPMGFWQLRQFARRAIRLCTAYGVKYFIKRDLAKHLGEFQFGNTDNRTVDRSKN